MKKREKLKINTLQELSIQLSLPEDFLLKTSDNLNSHYNKFKKTDKKGKERTFYDADKQLKSIHKRINKLLDTIQFPINIQGGVSERSIHTNAKLHSGRKYVANFDIKDFFPSLNHKTVYKAFINQKCVPDVSRLLTKLVTADGSLPQGFGTSPKVSGLILNIVNERLTKLFKKFGLSHSFWIDDLTVSGNYPIRDLEKLIFKIFSQAGFTLHTDPKKRKINDARSRQTCTNLVVNRVPNAQRSIRDKVRTELYLCNKFGVKEYLEANNIDLDVQTYLLRLGGKISFLIDANKNNLKLKEIYNKILKKYVH